MLEYQKSAPQTRSRPETGHPVEVEGHLVMSLWWKAVPATCWTAADTSRAACHRCGWARPDVHCCWATPEYDGLAAGSRGTAHAWCSARCSDADSASAAQRHAGAFTSMAPTSMRSTWSGRAPGSIAGHRPGRRQRRRVQSGLGAYLTAWATRSRLSVIARRASGQTPGRAAVTSARVAPTADTSRTRSSSPPWSFATVTTPRPAGSGSTS